MDSKIYQCSLANLNDPTAPPKTFTFDGCYYTDSTTEALYNEIAYPLVEVKKSAFRTVVLNLFLLGGPLKF
jgi:hypothetical protein